MKVILTTIQMNLLTTTNQMMTQMKMTTTVQVVVVSLHHPTIKIRQTLTQKTN
jgi:hypothetical protein